MKKETKPTATTRTATRQMRLRARIGVLLVTVGFFGAIVARLAVLQVVQANDWQRRAVSQQLSDTVVTAKRGTIYDSKMQPLAESAEVWKIIMSPKNIGGCKWQNLEGVDENQPLTDEQGLELQRRKIADDLSEMLGVDREKLYEQTGKTRSQYEVVKSKVEYKDKNAFSEWVERNGLSYAFYIITDYKRYYPQGSLASNVLGFTGTDNTGLEGLEARYESVLAGVPGRIVSAQNGIGNAMPNTMDYTKVVDAEDGKSLVTTIHPTVQMYAGKYLAEAVEETGTLNRGAAIVMDVNTGAILAMATKGDYDPNDPFTITSPTALEAIKLLSGDEKSEAISKARQLQWNNKAITETYEPGSVFKVFTTAMGLEENIINERSTFECKNGIMVDNWFIKCHTYPRAHGVLNLHQALSVSCNPYFIQLGLKIGPGVFYKYFNGFGFTEKTGVDMNGEMSNAGLYFNTEQLAEHDSSLAAAAFGQTFKVTPIQMITAMCAIANGGKLVTPHVVSQVLDGKGNVVSVTKPDVKRQIISESTSKRICYMLGDIVNGGGSKNAYVAGYRVAGKTGTSEKRDLQGRDEVVASFSGFAPADNPKVAVLVLLDEPQSPIRYGGTISAPVAQKIFESILPLLGVEPSYTEEELKSLSRVTPNVVDQTPAVAQKKASNMGLKTSIKGKGDKVVRQVPEAGQAIPVGGSLLLYTEESEVDMVTVPKLVGRSVTEVSTIAEQRGLNVQMTGLVSGSSNAVSSNRQSIAEGTKVPRGTVIQVNFLYEDVRDG